MRSMALWMAVGWMLGDLGHMAHARLIARPVCEAAGGHWLRLYSDYRVPIEAARTGVVVTWDGTGFCVRTKGDQ